MALGNGFVDVIIERLRTRDSNPGLKTKVLYYLIYADIGRECGMEIIVERLRTRGPNPGPKTRQISIMWVGEIGVIFGAFR